MKWLTAAWRWLFGSRKNGIVLRGLPQSLYSLPPEDRQMDLRVKVATSKAIRKKRKMSNVKEIEARDLRRLHGQSGEKGD